MGPSIRRQLPNVPETVAAANHSADRADDSPSHVVEYRFARTQLHGIQQNGSFHSDMAS
jgi:hypothetical protein